MCLGWDECLCLVFSVEMMGGGGGGGSCTWSTIFSPLITFRKKGTF